MWRKKWIREPSDKTEAQRIAEETDLDLLTVMLLLSRGLHSEEEMIDFLQGEESLSDPFLIRDIDRAAECIGRHIDAGSKITIFGDYDADGVTVWRVNET